MLTRVSWSPNTTPATPIITTSFKMPQTLNVTTEERCSSANCANTIQNARHPGRSSSEIAVDALPHVSLNAYRPSIISCGSSIEIDIPINVINTTGLRWNSIETGFDVAGCFRIKSWESAHRKPEKNADPVTRAKPGRLNVTSPRTIITSPAVITAMISASRRDGLSRRNRNANSRIKTRVDDLHAVMNVSDEKRSDILPSPMSSAVATPPGIKWTMYNRLSDMPRWGSAPGRTAEGGRLIRCGRREGTRYKNRAESENWTTWCRLVMNRGKGKEMMLPENIHLLYYRDEVSIYLFITKTGEETYNRNSQRKCVPQHGEQCDTERMMYEIQIRQRLANSALRIQDKMVYGGCATMRSFLLLR